ncbi:hypothetical protein GSI_00944 [Ganoderma sinense ZZ0214-1]|uniref:Uncharacterized protein n=1 Tax=Ganoderma sinense ZZ0214-1 TaxID=1077348 RepID=A0A2G8STZ5_9APHY|nr:hypothetical protein GSI_00944 [Ganoderma sinense ZZ0214-1]
MIRPTISRTSVPPPSPNPGARTRAWPRTSSSLRSPKSRSLYKPFTRQDGLLLPPATIHMVDTRMLTYDHMEPLALFPGLLEQTSQECFPYALSAEVLVHIQ